MRTKEQAVDEYQSYPFVTPCLWNNDARKISCGLHLILPLEGDYEAMAQEEGEHIWTLGIEFSAQESSLTIAWKHKGLMQKP